MARLSISLPDELLQELESKKIKFHSFSGFCCTVLEKGLQALEREQKIIEELNSRINK